MEKELKCPKCGSTNYCKNGSSGRGSKKKQKYRCNDCKKNFVKPSETLSRKEKRLLSLFLNFINYNFSKETTLKDVLKEASKELPKIGKLKLTVQTENANLDISKEADLIIYKNENNIEIVKTLEDDEKIILTIDNLAKNMNYFLK